MVKKYSKKVVFSKFVNSISAMPTRLLLWCTRSHFEMNMAKQLIVEYLELLVQNKSSSPNWKLRKNA